MRNSFRTLYIEKRTDLTKAIKSKPLRKQVTSVMKLASVATEAGQVEGERRKLAARNSRHQIEKQPNKQAK